ncbi:uncharacterized protein LOC122645036 [Telopea speciosissima]|uniref:uncharacterized protein LOC122645036 n=1 Tax=Telopea speciosissima TaxID=54955 RepID=UPI001CC62879|nr:uncharacterized protein LOC122645036 [Telopea speciosissima]
MVALTEPKIQFAKAALIMRRLGMDAVCSNGAEKGERIWVFWKNVLQVKVVMEHVQFVSLECSDWVSNRFLITFVHGLCLVTERRQLWADLLDSVRDTDLPWAVGGDFNAVLDPLEKVGGRAACSTSLEEFGNFVSDAGLVDGGFIGNSFTWSNNQSGGNKVVAHLDRFLFNGQWAELFAVSKVMHLSRVCSDHSPILLECATQVVQHVSTFKFQQMGISHPSFLDCVKECWEAPVHGSTLHVLFLKLKALRTWLRVWNKAVFGDIHHNVRRAEDRVCRAEIILEQNPSANAREDLEEASKALNGVLLQEEIFWRQKSRVRWLKEGDRNTNFFHTSAKMRRLRQSVSKIKDGNGDWISDASGIEAEAVRFFTDAFSSQGCTQDDDIF